jgi:holin-like protein
MRHMLPLGVLWLVSAAANALVQRLHSPVPGNALAIIVMLIALSTIRSAPRFFEATALLLARHLSLFFVPLAIAILGSWSAFVPIVFPLGLTLAGSVAIGIAVTGLVAQRLYHRAA